MTQKTKAIITWVLTAIAFAASTPRAKCDDLDTRFQQPNEESKPWCYWYWLGGDITAQGITNDLESMHTVGIKRAFIASIGGGGKDGANITVLSEEWVKMLRHALREAARLGIEIQMFNSPGWSMSGGPWIKPEQSMRRVIWTETEAKGGPFSAVVRAESEYPVQDIAVLAVPRKSASSITGTIDDKGCNFVSDKPITARSISFDVKSGYNFAGKLEAIMPDGSTRELLTVEPPENKRSAMDSTPTAPEAFSFEDTTAVRFRFKFDGKARGLTGATLNAMPMVSQYVEKQLGRLHSREFPEWKQHVYPDSNEPGDKSLVIQPDEIVRIRETIDADGRLTCTLPEGSWTVLCFGMTSTGKKNHPAPPEATGLECDKLSKSAARYHLESMFQPLFAKMTPTERGVIKGITVDSYEAGTQNWTDDFDKILEERLGYDPIPFMPTFTGRMVGSAEASDHFLWGLRRTVADLISENYMGTFAEIGDEWNLEIWTENYGSWGFPGEFLYYGKHSDLVSGEFWMGRDYGSDQCRLASSTAHVYGKPRVFAESFTSFIKPFHHPYVLKRRGDELLTKGVNHTVLHLMVHQPREGAPGKNPWYGVSFHRNNPWFLSSRSWVRYLQRMHTMLQEGRPSADVAVYIGDFTPQPAGPKDPVPWGYDFDYINSDIILNYLDYKDGKWVINRPGACSYRAIILPETGYMRPQVAARIRDLRKSGGTIFDAFPVTDEQLLAAGIRPMVSDANQDCRWKMRELVDGAIFLLCNFEKTGTFEVTLRSDGMAPELFNPVTGEIHKLATYRLLDGSTRVRFQVNDLADSRFIVFRSKASGPSVVGVDGDINLWLDEQNHLLADTRMPGTYTATLSDGSKQNVKVVIGSSLVDLKPVGKPNEMGHQAYAASFTLPKGIPNGSRIGLDMGDVKIMSGGTLNGQLLETRWMPPFSWDVTDMLKPGINELHISATALNLENPGEIKGPVELKWETQDWR